MNKNNPLTNAHFDMKIGFAYIPETGQVFRIKEVATTVLRKSDDRLVATKLNCNGNIAKVVSHIIWKIMTGNWPTVGMLMDHKDGNVENNVWGNLREATYQQNAANRESPGRWNNTGEHLEIGVVKEHNRYAVTIGQKYYGRFDCRLEANKVALVKRREIYQDFVREKPFERRV